MDGEARLPAADLARLLERTSRTFALAIPLLEPPLARQVGVAYLLLRVADELEDAPRWGRDRRARALASFASWLDGGEGSASPVAGGRPDDWAALVPEGRPDDWASPVAEGRPDDWAALVPEGRPDDWAALVAEERPTDDAGCLELLARAGDVRDAARAMPAEASRAILAHARRTALGMAEFVARQDERGGLALVDLDDLRAYAYVVAGIVGELLTTLFALAHAGVAAARAALDADAAAFGEGLQLVNILKDAPADAREGRAYVPTGTPRAAVAELARADLARASRYARALAEAGAPAGTVAFCELPIRLAGATLDRLDAGAAKLGRDEVLRIHADVLRRG